MPKKHELRLPEKLSPGTIEEWRKQIEAERCVPYVIEQIKARMTKLELPGPVIVLGAAWLPTNLWVIDKAAIVNDNTFRLEITLRWMGTRTQLSLFTNPLPGKGTTPPGFGLGFQLPHSKKWNIPLTKMPATNCGWATGVAPGVAKEHWPVAEAAIKKELDKLPWFGGEIKEPDQADEQLHGEESSDEETE
jgi:hypothetical protein